MYIPFSNPTLDRDATIISSKILRIFVTGKSETKIPQKKLLKTKKGKATNRPYICLISRGKMRKYRIFYQLNLKVMRWVIRRFSSKNM